MLEVLSGGFNNSIRENYIWKEFTMLNVFEDSNFVHKNTNTTPSIKNIYDPPES